MKIAIPESCPDELIAKIDAVIAEVRSRKLRPDLTPEEMERLQKYGAVRFESAGATRKR